MKLLSCDICMSHAGFREGGREGGREEGWGEGWEGGRGEGDGEETYSYEFRMNHATFA